MACSITSTRSGEAIFQAVTSGRLVAVWLIRISSRDKPRFGQQLTLVAGAPYIFPLPTPPPRWSSNAGTDFHQDIGKRADVFSEQIGRSATAETYAVVDCFKEAGGQASARLL